MSLRAKDLSIESIFPEMPKARKIIKVCVTDHDTDFQITLRALQGLINRDEPSVWVSEDLENENHWVKYFGERFQIPVTAEMTDVAFILQYASSVNGYVVYDNDKVIATQNIALSLAGIDRVLPVVAKYEPLLQKAGLCKKDDFRARFSDDFEAVSWSVEHIWPRCNRRMLANCCIHRPSWYATLHALTDYIVYNNMFCFDLAKNRAFPKQRALYRKILSTAEAPGVIMNWHCACEQEKEYVYESAREGFFTLCSINTSNISFQGAVGDPKAVYTQPLPDRSACKAERSKVYVCFYNSDGDAVWAMSSLHSLNWLHPDRGCFKFGWGFLPLTNKMMPGAMQYYHETKKPDDCFWGPSSGAGYTYSWAWPKDLVDLYLNESRRLLDKSGQNGCNMVNWFLQDYWRECEVPDAVEKEKELLGTEHCPGLVCGLGGNPYAISYPLGKIPKMHSVHIANVGANNISDIIRFSKECPTRPCFMFLFAQIEPGIFEQIKSELPLLADHPEIEILSMDEFFLTMQDAVAKGWIKDPVYDTNDTLAETWVKEPSRHRLPMYESLMEEFVDALADEPVFRAKRVTESAYFDLVSREIEGLPKTREGFTTAFAGRKPYTPDEENAVLFYDLFTITWGIVRGAVEALGVYCNERHKSIEDFQRLCSSYTDPAPFARIFDIWEDFDTAGAPEQSEIRKLAEEVRRGTIALNAALGDSSQFTRWPPKAI